MPHPWKSLRQARSRRISGKFVATLAAFMLSVQAHRLEAQLQSAATSSTNDGLRIKTQWPSSIAPTGGYLPIFVEIGNSRPNARDLRLVLRQSGISEALEVVRAVDVPANQLAQITLPVPVSVNGFQGELRIFEGSVELEALRQQGIVGGFAWGWSQLPSVLMISRAAPDWRTFDQAIASIFGAQNAGMQHYTLIPDLAPAQWIELSALDLVITSLNDLEQMPRECREALIAWMLTGGNVVIWGVTSAGDRERMDRLLDLPSRPFLEEWRAPRSEHRRVEAIVPNDNSTSWPQEALRRLNQQGLEAYRSYCSDLLQRKGTPNFESDWNNLAWTCVLAPDAVTDMGRIVQVAQRAVGSSGPNAAYLNTLGVAFYRAGNLQAATESLQRSMAQHGQGGIPEDWFFLAMIYHKLGDRDQAKNWMDKADRATTANPKPEWLLFRREAEAVLAGKDLQEALQGPEDVAKSARQAASANAAGASAGSTPVTLPFTIRTCGMGQLVTMPATDPFPGLELDWVWLFNTIGLGRLRWSDRHGMSGTGQNFDFWNFLIAGVGRAPVGAFQILITVFTVVIGPLNYFFFRKRKRLYLLIITVPGLALATSAILFGYSLASDGFEVRARVRSVALLDQTRREAVSWSRISYYAGLAPTGGLRFSTDTAVYPLQVDADEPGYRVVDWTDQQHLASGWLRSRKPTQFLAVAHRPSGEQISVATDVSEVPRVMNNLGARIHLLVLCDASGVLHVAEDVPKGARASTRVEQAGAAQDAVRVWIQGQRLDVPAEISATDTWSLFSLGMRGFSSSPAASWSTSLLEQKLRNLSAGPPQPFLKPGTYVAISERPPYLELGVPEASDVDCLYVTLGSF
jgi:tetratricopeptide (TPR) repeat protein